MAKTRKITFLIGATLLTAGTLSLANLAAAGQINGNNWLVQDDGTSLVVKKAPKNKTYMVTNLGPDDQVTLEVKGKFGATTLGVFVNLGAPPIPAFVQKGGSLRITDDSGTESNTLGARGKF